MFPPNAAQTSILLKAMREQFRTGSLSAEAEAERQSVGALLDAAGKVPLPCRPSAHRVVEVLPMALELLERQSPALALALAPIADGLPWRYSYQPRSDHPGLEGRMAWAEIVGPPQSLFPSQEVCFGLTLIGPHTHYPAHFHPAVELYQVVAGTAHWQLDGRWSPQPPGQFILHPANAVHAMRTEDEPLLAIYSWSGDIHTLSSYGADLDALKKEAS